MEGQRLGCQVRARGSWWSTAWKLPHLLNTWLEFKPHPPQPHQETHSDFGSLDYLSNRRWGSAMKILLIKKNMPWKRSHSKESWNYYSKESWNYYSWHRIFRLAVTTRIRLLTPAIFGRAKENVQTVNSPVRYQCTASHLFCDSERGNDMSTYCFGSSDLWTASIKGAL